MKRFLTDFLSENKIRRIVILSPHMDDAILSCGGLLDQLSDQVPMLVVTFATKDPSKIDRSESKFLMEVDLASPKVRMAEEKKALRAVGASLKELGFIDAVYRRGKNGRLLYPKKLFGYKTVPSKDKETLLLLKEKLTSIIRENDLLLYPLGIGGHIDHVLCKTVAKKLNILKMGYEDFPYIAWEKTPIEKNSFVINYVLKRKVDLIKIYKTQIKMLFGQAGNITKLLLKRSKAAVEYYRL